MIKVEWIAYGVDKNSDAGYRILGKSSGITSKAERHFVSLCSAVPLPEFGEEYGHFYFGESYRGKHYRCRGESIGMDRFGREGAWVFYGFILPRSLGSNAPCHLAEILRQKCNIKSAEPLELEQFGDTRASVAPELLAGLLADHGRLTLAIPHDKLGKATETVDAIVGTSPNERRSYVLPAANDTPRFDIVGLSLDKVTGKVDVVPLARPAPGRRARRYAVFALVCCSIVALGFGSWGIMRMENARRATEDSTRKLNRIDAEVIEMYRTAEKVRDVRAEQTQHFGQVANSNSKDVQLLSVKVGTVTYTFTQESSGAVLDGISDLLERIRHLRATVQERDP